MEKFQTERTFECHSFHYIPVRSFDQKERGMSLEEISVYLYDVRVTRVRMGCGSIQEKSKRKEVK